MVTVSNTSPLSNLALIGRLDILRALFGEVTIPPAVATELSRLPDDHAREALLAAQSVGGWLRVRAPSEDRIVMALELSLDAGEAAAIALATEFPEATVLIDERKGRRAALKLGLSVIGIVGILLKAKKRGLIPSVRKDLLRLKTEAGFFISDALVQEAARLAGE